MRVIITEHAKKRLKDCRQSKLTISDILIAAEQIPGFIPTATRFRGFLSKSDCLILLLKIQKVGEL